jgi:hypothetical protein
VALAQHAAKIVARPASICRFRDLVMVAILQGNALNRGRG